MAADLEQDIWTARIQIGLPPQSNNPSLQPVYQPIALPPFTTIVPILGVGEFNPTFYRQQPNIETYRVCMYRALYFRMDSVNFGPSSYNMFEIEWPGFPIAGSDQEIKTARAMFYTIRDNTNNNFMTGLMTVVDAWLTTTVRGLRLVSKYYLRRFPQLAIDRAHCQHYVTSVESSTAILSKRSF
ncbi:hypothetical protein DFH27DRAFT_613723 [Peziza echinospora]|nr:hypothetical protein DFH27DRAFT_613723 [Peziza echinospora]